MSAARRLPSPSITSSRNTGCGRLVVDVRPYSFTISARSARVLSLATFSARSCIYAFCMDAVSLDIAAIAPFSVLIIFTISSSMHPVAAWAVPGVAGTCSTLPGEQIVLRHPLAPSPDLLIQPGPSGGLDAVTLYPVVRGRVSFSSPVWQPNSPSSLYTAISDSTSKCQSTCFL